MILGDAFDRQQLIDLGFHLSTQLLKKGEQHFRSRLYPLPREGTSNEPVAHFESISGVYSR